MHCPRLTPAVWLGLALSLLLASPAHATKRTVVLVADLAASKVSEEDAATISALLRGALARERKFILVQRGEMEIIAEELNFQMSGCTDQGCAVRLGEMLNAEKVVVGRVAKLFGRLTITAEIVDMAANDIEFAEKVDCDEHFASVEEAIATLAKKLSGHVPVLAEVKLVKGNVVVLEGGTRDGMAPGQQMQVLRSELVKDRQGRPVMEKKKVVGELVITYANARDSEARTVSGAIREGDYVQARPAEEGWRETARSPSRGARTSVDQRWEELELEAEQRWEELAPEIERQMVELLGETRGDPPPKLAPARRLEEETMDTGPVAGVATAPQPRIQVPDTARPIDDYIIWTQEVWSGDVRVARPVIVTRTGNLTLQPGTRVFFDMPEVPEGKDREPWILVQGTMVALGSPKRPILFQSTTVHHDEWDDMIKVQDGREARFRNCVFERGPWALHLHETDVDVFDCTFGSNYGGVRFQGNTVTLRGNRFVGNRIGIRCLRASPVIERNQFSDNLTGIYFREGVENPVLRDNNFANREYDLKLGEAQSADVYAAQNWWRPRRGGEDRIYDGNDSEGIGFVVSDPPLTAPWSLATTQ